MFSLFIITNNMLDFLVLLLDIPCLLADFSPRAKHKGESLYWRFMGIFLLAAELVILFLWDITESPPATGLPVRMGGPAFCEPGGAFVPGRYLKYGYVITSRGCPNRCWFCSVPKREGGVLRELPITSGWNVLDDNLLACSEAHIRAVFAMLMQRQERPAFTGGLEARLLRPWHVELLQASRAKRMFFAYDTPDDYEPLIAAGRLLRSEGVTQTSHRAACYVLIGYPGDTMDAAEKRLLDTYRAGFWPFAMLYRDASGKQAEQWHKFQRLWVRPQSVYYRIKAEFPDGFTEL